MEGTSGDVEDGSLPDLTEVNILFNTGEEKDPDRDVLPRQHDCQTDIGGEKGVLMNEGKFHGINSNLKKACGQIDEYVKTAFDANKCKHTGKRKQNSRIHYTE